MIGLPPVFPINLGSLPMFYKDTDLSIQNIIYLGLEFQLLLFDVIVFGAFGIWTKSTLVSIALTYLLDMLFSWFRNWQGKRNISNKTLIDDMFLV